MLELLFGLALMGLVGFWEGSEGGVGYIDSGWWCDRAVGLGHGLGKVGVVVLVVFGFLFES